MNQYLFMGKAEVKVKHPVWCAKGPGFTGGQAARQTGLKGLLRSGLASGFALFSLLLPLTPVCGETLVVGGTGAALGVMQRLADAYQADHPGTRIRVLPSMGTGGAIRATAKGKIDLGLGGRRIGDKERGYGLVEIPYARSPLVFVVPRELPVSNITTEEIIAFYQGRQRHWPGGERCRPIVRPPGDSETLALRSQAPVLSHALDQILQTPGIRITMTAQENAEVIGGTRGSFGYSTLTLLLSERPPLKVLSYNGVEATPENLTNGSYPFYKTLYMMTRPKPDPAVARFMEFVKSRQGEEILRRFGNLPLQ